MRLYSITNNAGIFFFFEFYIETEFGRFVAEFIFRYAPDRAINEHILRQNVDASTRGGLTHYEPEMQWDMEIGR